MSARRPARRRLAAALAAVPVAFVVLLAVQAALASRREYLPDDPGYVVEATAVPQQGAQRDDPIRMVMLGDSTVAGLGSPTAGESLPVLTAQRVADRTGREVVVRGLGVSGARTRDVRDEQLALADEESPDVVVIVVGSNDVTHLTPPWRFDDLTRSMLERARGGGAPVVHGGIPLFGSATALAHPLRATVDAYASVLRSIQADIAASVPGVTFVDIASLASPRFEGVPEAMSEDGFHPGPVGYGFWADALAPAVAAAVS